MNLVDVIREKTVTISSGNFKQLKVILSCFFLEQKGQINL